MHLPIRAATIGTMTDDKVKRRLTTVLCADVHGYSRLMEADETGTLETLRRYFSETGQLETFDEASEVQILRGMRDALTPKLPVSEKSELRTRLSQALEQENYELAAILRDELKQLKE